MGPFGRSLWGHAQTRLTWIPWPDLLILYPRILLAGGYAHVYDGLCLHPPPHPTPTTAAQDPKFFGLETVPVCWGWRQTLSWILFVAFRARNKYYKIDKDLYTVSIYLFICIFTMVWRIVLQYFNSVDYYESILISFCYHEGIFYTYFYTHGMHACLHTCRHACIPCVLLLFPRRSRVLSVCIHVLRPPPPLVATIYSILAFLIWFGGYRTRQGWRGGWGQTLK